MWEELGKAFLSLEKWKEASDVKREQNIQRPYSEKSVVRKEKGGVGVTGATKRRVKGEDGKVSRVL